MTKVALLALAAGCAATVIGADIYEREHDWLKSTDCLDIARETGEPIDGPKYNRVFLKCRESGLAVGRGLKTLGAQF